MSERATRKGSYWTRKVPAHNGGDLVRIVAGSPIRRRPVGARRRIGDDRWAPVAMILFVRADNPDVGSMMHEADFREDYDWVRGR